jgi:hypothetical protein
LRERCENYNILAKPTAPARSHRLAAASQGTHQFGQPAGWHMPGNVNVQPCSLRGLIAAAGPTPAPPPKFRMNFRTSRTLPIRRRCPVHDGPAHRGHTYRLSFWFKPVSTFGLYNDHDVYQKVHICWSYPVIPSPSPRMCSQIRLPLTARRTH